MIPIAPYWTREGFIGEVFTRSAFPFEPMKLAIARLERAVRWDYEHVWFDGYDSWTLKECGLIPMFTPLSVWYAYNKHKTLSMKYEDVRRNLNRLA